ncbi:axin isoform X2 [Chironomus tepperi]|uniref:axin isoform X2 n=1 Tax=Chironomus tepperi TaxID=113505 RepID=UPI00391F077E
MNQNFNDYDSIGLRPPIPGEETSKKFKMTDSAQSELHLFMTSSSSSQSSSSPSCLKWARTLGSLLEDREGVELFKKYVESEGGIHSDRLNFYFACEGLKQQSDPDKVKQIIGAIYRFLKKSELLVPDDIRRAVKAGLKDEIILTPDVYDQMQHDVERIINETTYPNFLQSEMYVQYVQQAQQTTTVIERSQYSQQQQQATISTSTTTATSSTISETSSKFLSRSSTLPTLMEEAGDGCSVGDVTESVSDPINRMPSTSTSKVPMSLTKDALMATQRRRLEMRSPGDGRPQRRHHHHHHHQSSLERRMIRENIAINNTESLTVIPRTQRVDVKSHTLSSEEFLKILLPKLEAVKKEQDRMELLNKKLLEVEQSKSNKLFADAISAKLMLDDDKDDQDILDEHVSRVWSDRTPLRSPGNLSPCNQLNQFQRRKMHETTFSCGSSIQSSMRVSKSMPDSNMRRFTKWGSINTDSGISLFSSDTMTIKHKDAMSISSSSSGSTKPPPRPAQALPADVSKLTPQQIEELRRSKRAQQQQMQPPLPQKNVIPPPIPAKNLPQPPQATQQPAITEHTTTVVYSFCDEDVPYRIKIPGKSPLTLKQFKDFLPKKGNYRFFFKTRCDDDDNPIIQEEILNDTDVLPLFDDKVMATVKSAL